MISLLTICNYRTCRFSDRSWIKEGTAMSHDTCRLPWLWFFQQRIPISITLACRLTFL